MNFPERMRAYVTLGAMGLVWEEVSPLLRIAGAVVLDRDSRRQQ